MPLFKKQQLYFDQVTQNDAAIHCMLAGGVSSGKSFLQIGILHEMCMHYEAIRVAVIRKNLSTLKRTSIPTYEKVLDYNGDSDCIEFNRADFIAKYKNGSVLMFIEADTTKDPQLNKLRGLELTTALMEEANEMMEMVFSILITRVGRWKNDTYKIKPLIMLNCNPDKGWVKDKFYDPSIENRLEASKTFIQVTPFDNPHNTKEYIHALNELPESEKQRFVMGNWEVADDPNQLILYPWMKANITEDSFETVYHDGRSKNQIYLGIDMARMGNDRIVFSYFIRNKLLKIEIFRKKDNQEVADLIEERVKCFEILPSNIGIDVGMGVGTIDILKRKQIRVHEFNFGAKCDEKPNQIMRYKNKRAEAYWLLRSALQNNEIQLKENKDLLKEALAIHYFIDDKTIQIESKDALKKRLGVSPDVLDSVVISNYMRVRRSIFNIAPDSIMVSHSSTIKNELENKNRYETVSTQQKGLFHIQKASRLLMADLQ